MSFLRHTEKLETVLYAVSGLILAVTPIFLEVRSRFFTPISIKINAPVSFLKKNFALFSCPVALLVFQKLYSFNGFTPILWLSFFSIFIALLSGFLLGLKLPYRSRVGIGIALLFFSVMSIVINFSTSFINSSGSLVFDGANLWHHWSAYLSAVKAADSGSIILKDFPTQYGLGPTVLIGVFSGFGWITGMFYAVGLLQCCFWFALGGIAICLIRRRLGANVLISVVALFVMTGLTYFWDGTGIYPNLHPSLGGTRFFPAALLTWAIIFFDPNQKESRKISFIHILWAFAAVWSIESVFYACLIWWPYYLLIYFPQTKETGRFIFLNLVNSILNLLKVSAITLFCFLLIYFILFQCLPDLSLYKAFVDHIPGPLLIDIKGRFIFSVFIFGFSYVGIIWIHRKSGASQDFRNLLVLTTLAFGPYSYYVGRSDDYNLLPTVPFFGLILFKITLTDLPKFMRFTSFILLLAIASFDWTHVIAMPYQTSQNFFEFRAEKLNEYFYGLFESPNTDRGRAIRFIDENYHESIVSYDVYHSMVFSTKPKDWNAFNNLTAYFWLPDDLKLAVINRSKNKLMRSGWLIFDEANGEDLKKQGLALFINSYEIDKIIPFGKFTAYRFIPKPKETVSLK